MERINDKINEIANSIVNYIHNDKNQKIGLYDGDFGILLFLAYYAKLSKRKNFECIFDEYMDSCLDKLSKGLFHSTFCSGISGILYSIAFLNENKFTCIDIEDAHNAYEDYLVGRMFYDIHEGHYDFMHNSLGIGFYLLKSKDNSTYKNLDLLVDALDRHSIKGDATAKWASILNMENKIGYNICMSHGISSIVIFLSKVIQNDLHNKKAILLLRMAVNYILSQEIDVSKYGSYFPSTSIETENNILKSRLAWCYGDLGVASAIWQAGKTLDNQQWKDKALEVFRYATTRTELDSNFVRDAGICHGTAGIAQIFKRMYIETGIEDFKIANEYWIQETIKMAKFEDGAAGYKAYHGINGEEWKSEYSFLEGIAGIGLSLISYLSDNPEDSTWDEILLLS